MATPRIGITKAADWPLRFFIAGLALGVPLAVQRKLRAGPKDPPSLVLDPQRFVLVRARAAGVLASIAQADRGARR